MSPHKPASAAIESVIQLGRAEPLPLRLQSQNKEELVRKYLPLVRAIARKTARHACAAMDYDDMVSAGCLGLLQAIESFQPERGIHFSTYCAYRIRGRIMDELRKLDWVPRSVRRKTRQHHQAQDHLQNKLDHRPTDGEIADALNLTPVPSKKWCDWSAAEMVHICGEDDETARSWWQQVQDPTDDTANEQASREHLHFLLANRLTALQRLVIHGYYNQGLTMKQIGRQLNLCESRISQIHSQTLAKLRKLMDPDAPSLKIHPPKDDPLPRAA